MPEARDMPTSPRLGVVNGSTQSWGGLAPRAPAVNVMPDVAGFVARWDDPGGGYPADWFTLVETRYGNIGSDNDPGGYSAPDMCPHDAQWSEALESMVRPIVATLVHVFGLITYTSCQGHRYPDLDLPCVPLEVGILPRDPAEYAAVELLIENTVREFMAHERRPSAIRCRGWSNGLLCERTHISHPVVDVTVEPSAGSGWDPYFAELPDAVTVLDGVLRSAVGRETEPHRDDH